MSVAFGSFLRLIRFEHTLFALPYAFCGMLLAARGWPETRIFGWILVAMVAARTAAMTFNRLVDRRFDAANPRTSRRPSVTGEVTPVFMILATLASAGLFLHAAWRLNPLAFRLAGPTLLVLLGYSSFKRFSSLSHLVLGLALGLSPLGAWVAVRGTLAGSWCVLWLGLAVTFWSQGFDILYACQDESFDRGAGLHSVPARFGTARALRIARASHVLVPPFLFLTGWAADMGAVFHGSVALVALLLAYEHRLVRADDLSRVNQAFFGVNVVIGFVVLVGLVVDLFVLGHAGVVA